MLKVNGIPELEAAAALFAHLDKPTMAAMRKESTKWAPKLRAAAVQGAKGPIDHAIAASGKTTVTAKGLRAVFGSGSFHGEPLSALTRPWEFGTARPQAKTSYLSRQRTSRRAMKVTRRTQLQVPKRAVNGRFIYPAVARATPDLVSLWVRAVVKAVTDG